MVPVLLISRTHSHTLTRWFLIDLQSLTLAEAKQLAVSILKEVMEEEIKVPVFPICACKLMARSFRFWFHYTALILAPSTLYNFWALLHVVIFLLAFWISPQILVLFSFSPYLASESLSTAPILAICASFMSCPRIAHEYAGNQHRCCSNSCWECQVYKTYRWGVTASHRSGQWNSDHCFQRCCRTRVCYVQLNLVLFACWWKIV